jgi:hypothetical protein
MFNSSKTQTECFVWSDSPDQANTFAVAVWNRYSAHDCAENIDGKGDKPGEKHQSSAIIQNGSSCLNVFVETVNPFGLGVQNLKKCLKSRGQNCLTPGKKGKEAKAELAARLKEYVKPPPSNKKRQQEDENVVSAKKQKS